MKRRLWLGVLVLILAMVTACGGRGPEVSAPDPARDAEDSPSTTPTATPPRPVLEAGVVTPPPDYSTSVYGYLEALDPVDAEVTLWYAYPDARQFQFEALVQEFNLSNPWGITVIAENFDTPALLYQEIITGIPKLNYPTVALVDSYQIPAYTARGALVSFAPYMESATWGMEAALDDLAPAAQPSPATADYGWPWAATTHVLLYNRDWLNELGHTAPPTSWEDLETMACATTRQSFSRATGEGAVIGLLYTVDVDNFISLTRNNGGEIVGTDTLSATFAGPPGIEVLTTLRALTQRRCATRHAEVAASPEAFGTGRALFAFVSIADLPAYRGEYDVAAAFSWGATALPRSTPRPVQSVRGSRFVLFNVRPESQLAAWLFMQWLTELEQQAWWLTATNEIPAQAQTLRLLPEYLAENPAYAHAVALTATSAHDEPLLAGYPACRALLAEALTAIDGGANIQTTLEAAEEACTALLHAAAR